MFQLGPGYIPVPLWVMVGSGRVQVEFRLGSVWFLFFPVLLYLGSSWVPFGFHLGSGRVPAGFLLGGVGSD